MTTMTLDNIASEDFEQARRKVFWRNLVSWLFHEGNTLSSLSQIRQGLSIKSVRYLGLQTVTLDKIVGSEGRDRDFDRAFFPRQSRTRERWISIDLAHYQHVPLPPIELVKVGDRYFVMDGNHRVSVARVWGQEFIEAHVTELNVSDAPESEDLSDGHQKSIDAT